MESFWENLVEIFVTNFYASRVSLSIPYDLTDITNTPWGLKATYNDSVQKQQTRIKLERRQSQEAPPPLGDSESDASENTPTVEYPPKSAPRREKGIPTMTSINSQLDSMLNGRTKVYPNLKALDRDDDPLIDNAGVNRVLERGSIVMLSREYRDPEAMRRREEEILKTHQKELEEEKAGEDPRSQGPVLSKEKTTSSIPTKKDVLTAWEQTFFKPNVSGQITKYSEYEQPLASPWLQSPGPSPAILKEPTESPFFHNVESSFSSDDEEDYRSSDAVYAIGMENYRSVIHLPLVHPQTSKSISSGGESSSSSGRPPIVPIAIISFLSTVIPYPSHLITSLSSFSPLIATSLSQAIRHSNVLHQLANSPMPSPQIRRKRLSTPEERLRIEESNEDSPVTQSPGTSETSTPSWELKGHLFSPAVAEAETPSPFRSTLSTETDYFSQMHRSPQPSRATSIRSSSDTQKSRFGSESEDVRPSSSKSSWSQDTAPTKQSTTTDKQVTPIKIYRRARKSPRTIHSYGATTQYTSSYRTTYRKPKAARTRTESFAGSDPYQMHTPSSRLLKVVVDSIPVHVFTALPGTGAITWANGRTLAYRGVTAETYIEHPHDAIHPRDRDEFLERWNRMLRLETDGISQSLRIRRFDGQYRWFAAKVVPLRDARGGVVHWFGTAMDIHDAREAEIKSARQEEIEASELKYRSLAEVSPQIVFAATPALGISYANSQWMAYSGVTYGDTTQLGFLSFVHPDDRVKCALPAKGNDTQFQVEIRLLSASGVYRWHLVKCVRIEDRDGKDDLWLGTWYAVLTMCLTASTDIHEHKMLEHRLKDLNEAARAAEAEHRKRADDALETRRQQEFFIVCAHIGPSDC